MNDLRRELAPVTDEAWRLIEEEIRRSLKVALSGRRLVDFSGPHGWDFSSVNLGRARPADERLAQGVQSRIRMVQPLVELRSVFELLRDDIDSAGRGADDIDLKPAVDAALRLAHAEDTMVYYGHSAAAIRGMVQASPHEAHNLPSGYGDYAEAVADAMETLRKSGVQGPYALALDNSSYTSLSKTTVGGFPMLAHVRRLLHGPVVWAPAINGAVVLSRRGGDFQLVAGRDISVGYLDHDSGKVRLYMEESITFRVLAPEAAIALKHAAA